MSQPYYDADANLVVPPLASIEDTLLCLVQEAGYEEVLLTLQMMRADDERTMHSPGYGLSVMCPHCDGDCTDACGADPGHAEIRTERLFGYDPSGWNPL